jgi:3-hydroxy-3-methylglutaryl CoA synthase/uncharacterized OB-fold protein
MSTYSITQIGGYLPLTRFDRKAAAAALKWSGLGGPRTGRRAVAGWDEDALTLAVEAARLASAGANPAQVIFASTSAAFYERAQAALLAEALALPLDLGTNDVSGSRRCAVSALLQSLRAGTGPTLIAAGEKRPTKPGSALQLAFGDGGAAVLTGAEGGAKLRGFASLSLDFIDIYASREHPTPYQAEERFIRDRAVDEILLPVIKAACAHAGISPEAITLAAVAEPVNGCYKAAAARLKLTAPNLAAELTEAAGDLGAAHPLFALALAFAQAKPGDIVLLLGFGSGADALLFEVTGEIAGAAETALALKAGRASVDYVRFLSLTGSIDLDWGVRSEFEQKTNATVLDRHGRDMMGFVGGRDHEGNVQFPKSRIPVNPHAPAPERLADVRLADEPAAVVSVTADRLNFSPDPPFYFGLVQFANGARVLMEFTDAAPGGFAVADTLAMRFRIKSIDRKRGFKTYFWKAAPARRPQLED